MFVSFSSKKLVKRVKIGKDNSTFVKGNSSKVEVQLMESVEVTGKCMIKHKDWKQPVIATQGSNKVVSDSSKNI